MNKPTKNQQIILDSRDENLLVSASAGTGKTTVMVQRIVALILEGRLDLDNLLAVTFTNLAAAEMKKKIADELALHGDNERARVQAEKLDNCAICTIHKLCASVLRNYFYVVDVDPSFAILDDVTAGTLANEAMDNTVNAFSKDDDFSRLFGVFLKNRKEDNLRSCVERVYAFSRCRSNFALWWSDARARLLSPNPDFFSIIIDDIKMRLNSVRGDFLAIGDVAAELTFTNIAAACQDNATACSCGAQTLEGCLRALASCKVRAAGKFKVDDEKKGVYSDVKEKFSAAVDDARKIVDDYEDFTQRDFAELTEEMRGGVALADKLVEFVVAFDKEFYRLKKQRGCLDFNDLERLTAQVLEDADAQKELQDKYKMVFVDEYQDTNGVQEDILSKISQKNLFMVGDIKQSIYGFRQCDPQIFAAKRIDFDAREGCRVVPLNENFRSDEHILNFVNVIFNHAMTTDFGGENYEEQAQLKGSRSQTSAHPAVSVDVVCALEDDDKEITDVYDLTKDTLGCDTSVRREAQVICARIKELVGSTLRVDGEVKTIGYGDIVILSRSMTDKAGEICKCLVEHNIPVAADFKTGGFASKELRDVLSFLRVLDNPLDDVALCGVCLSWFGKLTEDELALAVADCDAKQPLLLKLQQSQNEKIKNLLDLIDECRFYSYSVTVERLVLKLIEKTNYHLFVQGMPNGNIRIKKLYAFLDDVKGKDYASSVDKFLEFVEAAKDKDGNKTRSSAGAVRMMTMHASKGLEFPVVFLCNTSSRFIFDDASRFVVEKDVGLAFNHFDFSERSISQTLSAAAAKLQKAKRQREEEMRLLYVAMTRAKNHLFVMCSKGEKQLASERTKLPQKAFSQADWLISSIVAQYGTIRKNCVKDDVRFTFWRGAVEQENVSYSAICQQTDNLDDTFERINFVYPHQSATSMPAKVVSSALDKLYTTEEQRDLPLTFSLEPKEERADVGTDFHKLLQNARLDGSDLNEVFDSLYADGQIKNHLDLLLAQHALANAAFVKLTSSGKVYREIPFMLKTSAKNLMIDAPDEETVLQGVLDLLIIREDKAIVVDYKYTSRTDLVKERYQRQLDSYALAVKSICKIDVVEKYVLSLSDGKLIKM